MNTASSEAAIELTAATATTPIEAGASAVANAGAWRRRIKVAAYLAAFAVLLALFIDGYSYYTTPLSERPHHPDYRILRPAGSRGLLYGISGAALMVLMLGYTLRKRFRALSRWGALPIWLDFHIFCGVVGPLLVVLHTSFKIQGLVAVAFWAMVCVAVSGVLGRYLYLQIPRNLRGDQLTLEEIRKLKDELRAELRGQFGLSDAAIAHLEGGVGHRAADGGWRSMFWFVFDDLISRVRRGTPLPALAGAGRSHAQIHRLNDLIGRMSRLDRRIAVWGQMQRLFHYWHVFHKPFAIVMYVVMGIHIVVAVWTGYGWMF